MSPISILTSPSVYSRTLSERVTADIETPSSPLITTWRPRDLYPLDANDDPTRVQGRLEAVQRGVNSGLVYLHLTDPAFGSVLYFQNLTALKHQLALMRESFSTFR